MSSPTPPLPEISGELRPFFEGARRGELLVQRCRGCGTVRFPPRPVCSQCLGRDAEWIRSTGRGTIYSFNVMHQVYHPAFRDAVPYGVVLVELDEGCRMISNLVDCPPGKISIGMPVEVTFEPVDGDVFLPKFRPRRNDG